MNEQNIFWALNIKYLRKRKNMSQQQMAKEIGISRSRLNTHERGQIINPTLNDLLDFSQYFGIRVDTLLQTDLAALQEPGMKLLESDNEVYFTGSMIKNLASAVFGEKMRRQAMKHKQQTETGNTAINDLAIAVDPFCS